MLGTLFTPEEAKAIGLIDEVVPADQLMERALEAAEEYLQVSGEWTLSSVLR